MKLCKSISEHEPKTIHDHFADIEICAKCHHIFSFGDIEKSNGSVCWLELPLGKCPTCGENEVVYVVDHVDDNADDWGVCFSCHTAYMLID